MFVTGLLMTSSLLYADTDIDANNKKQIESVVHDYLVSNPEVLLEASQVLQQRQQQDMQKQAKSAVMQNAKDLFAGKLSTVGNLKGDVTLVEFFDYQCIHCKQLADTMHSLLQKNNNLKIVYQEFPIFGQTSELASRAALASGMQSKYEKMHNALLKATTKLDEARIMDIAKSVGLNIEKLKKDMSSEAVNTALAQSRILGEKLHLMGTPALVVASTPKGSFVMGGYTEFLPGAASEQALQALIDKAKVAK